MNLYVGLVHYPVSNKKGDIITSSVTNLDIHDIARSCRSFDVKKYFIITPIEAQHHLVERILHHWMNDNHSSFNPDRKEALRTVQLAHSIDQVNKIIADKEKGEYPLLATTSTRPERINGDEKQLLEAGIDRRSCLLLFGTGWGLHSSVMDQADFTLAPIGNRDYNHLSVRGAVAIYLDRLHRIRQQRRTKDESTRPG